MNSEPDPKSSDPAASKSLLEHPALPPLLKPVGGACPAAGENPDGGSDPCGGGDKGDKNL